MLSTFVVGAEVDFDKPDRLPFTGQKCWESGKYNFVILYENKNMRLVFTKVYLS
jgi:hypothetical protein